MLVIIRSWFVTIVGRSKCKRLKQVVDSESEGKG